MIFFSCGLKVTNEIDDNILLGDWELTGIKCYLAANPTAYVEYYDVSSNNDLTVTMEYEGRNIQYTAESISTCTASANGIYSADFNGTGIGTVDLLRIVSGDGTSCNVTLPFSGNGGAGANGDVIFALISPESKDLGWSVNEDKSILSLDMFTSFKGSNENLFCDSSCDCVGEYKRL